MKHFRLWLLLAICLGVAACAKEAVEPMPTPDIGTVDHSVSVEQALSDLNTLLGELDGGTRAGARTVGTVATLHISDLLPQTRATEAPAIEDLVYIVNFENNEGYALLGADDRLPGVVAIMDEGSLTPEALVAVAQGKYGEKNDAAPPIFPGAAAYLMYATSEIQEENPNSSPSFITDIDHGGIIPPLTGPFKYREYGEWISSKFIFPMLIMKWDQIEPYNLYCPNIVIDGKEVSGYVGCVAVALGQIIMTNQRLGKVSPSDYFGGYCIDYWTLNKAISKDLLKDAGVRRSFYSWDRSQDALTIATFLRAIGAAVGMLYTPTGSYPANINSVLPFFQEMDMREPVFVPYAETTVCMMLEKGLPIYAQGYDVKTDGGHAWVIDGLHAQQRNVTVYLMYGPGIDKEMVGTEVEPRTLFHCNYGYGGRGDGFYYSGIFDLDKGPENLDPRGDLTANFNNYNFRNKLKLITYKTRTK